MISTQCPCPSVEPDEGTLPSSLISTVVAQAELSILLVGAEGPPAPERELTSSSRMEPSSTSDHRLMEVDRGEEAQILLVTLHRESRLRQCLIQLDILNFLPARHLRGKFSPLPMKTPRFTHSVIADLEILRFLPLRIFHDHLTQ